MKKIAITFVSILVCTLLASLLYGCNNRKSKTHLAVEARIKEALEENKYKDYKSIKYSPLYAFTVIKEEKEAFREILSQNVSDREVEEYIDNSEDLYNSTLDQESIERIARDVLADKWFQIGAIFMIGGTAINADTYKEIIYRDQVIRDNKLTPENYIIFHKFSFKDKYNEEYTEYVGALVDSTSCYFSKISRDVELLIDTK